MIKLINKELNNKELSNKELNNKQYILYYKTVRSGIELNESENSIYKTVWSYPTKPKTRKNTELNQYKEVYTDEFIFDIDMALSDNEKKAVLKDIDYTGAIETVKNIIKWFNKQYSSLKINVWFSGRKGFHISIKFDKYYHFRTNKYNKTTNQVIAYNELVKQFNQEIELIGVDIDNGISQVNRLIQLPNKRKNTDKNESLEHRGYKICIWNTNEELTEFPNMEEVINASKENKNLIDPITNNRVDCEDFINYLNELNPTDEITINKDVIKVNNSLIDIIEPVLNELEDIHKTDGHKKVRCPIIYNCMAYLPKESMNEVIDILKTIGRGTDPTNTRQGLENAYKEGKPNEWAIYHALGCSNTETNEENKKRKSLYQHFKNELELYGIKESSKEINKLLDIYDNDLIRLYDNKLFDYVDNSKNILKGVINSLASLMGYTSRFLVVNGGSGAGKSEYVNTINKLMPDFINLGSSTPARVRRSERYRFNRKIVYLGDRGLRGLSQNSRDEFEGLFEVFGCLTTEGIFIRGLMEGDEGKDYILESDGVTVFFTQPYTNLNVFGASDQYITRCTYITVNPVKNPLKVFLESDNKKNNDFYELHKNYIKYIVNNPIEINLTEDVQTKIFNSCNCSLRMSKYVRWLFRAYCQFLRINEPRRTDLDKFLEVFTVNFNINDVEYLLYELLYNNLKKINETDIYQYLTDYGDVKDDNLILKQRTNRKDKIFFTASKIKTYFKLELKHNANLKDTVDNVPEMLRNLYCGGYIETIENKSPNRENIYYIHFNDKMEKEN